MFASALLASRNCRHVPDGPSRLFRLMLTHVCLPWA